MDILENQVMDTRLHQARVCYSPDFVSSLPLVWDLLGFTEGDSYVCPTLVCLPFDFFRASNPASQ